MPLEHLSADDRDELDQQLATLDFDSSLNSLKDMRDSAECRTELVSDPAGVFFIRKTFPKAPETLSRGLMLMHVRSPYIAHVERCYELGDSDVMVIEYINGATLRNRVKTAGVFDVDMSLKLLREMVQGACALHEAKPHAFVHRDINPDNIIIRVGGDGALHACLIDYSIARAVRDDAATDTRHLGTQRYAAPEQYGFKQTDARSDIFALGLVLVFMLTGSDPVFDENGLAAGIEKLPVPVRGVVQRCTAFDPARRYTDDRALLADIDRASAGSGAGQGGAPPDVRAAAARQNMEGAVPEGPGHGREAGRAWYRASWTAVPPIPAGEDGARAQQDSRRQPYLWQRVKAATSHGKLHIAWNAWRVVLTVAFVLLVYLFIDVSVNPPANQAPNRYSNLQVSIEVILLWMLPAYVLATDFNHFWEHYLYINPVKRTLLIVLVTNLVFWAIPTIQQVFGLV